MSVRAELADVGLFGSIDRFGDLGVHAMVDLRRSFTREELEQAFRRTVTDFPVLGCVYRPGFFRDAWMPTREPLSDAVHVVAEGDLEAETYRWTRKPLDACADRPLRVVSLARGKGCRLIVSLSHLAVDGAGMGAVGHVFGSHLYGLPPATPVESRRDLGPTLAGLSWKHLPVLARDAVTTLLQPLRTYAAGRRETSYASSPWHEATSRRVILEPDEVRALQARCAPGLSVNDLLVSAMARVSAQRTRKGPVVVIYTMDLRRFAGRAHLSATNASSILTAVVPREATGELASAAAAVRKLTARHRSSLVGPAFLLVPLALAAGTPHGLLRRVVPRLHTVLVDVPLDRGLILTNVGRIDPGLAPFADDLEDVRLHGPNIRGVSTPTVVAFGFRGRLHLELFAPPGLGEAALDSLERELHDALELGHVRGQT